MKEVRRTSAASTTYLRRTRSSKVTSIFGERLRDTEQANADVRQGDSHDGLDAAAIALPPEVKRCQSEKRNMKAWRS